MKQLLFLFCALLTTVGMYAQTDAEYEAALAAINSGGCYRISTEVNGVLYYVTINGGLSSDKAESGLFSLSKVTGGSFKPTGIRISSFIKRFTNPPLSYDVANLMPGAFATTEDDRVDWETQVLFLNTAGKYAIRSCNTTPGTNGWEDAGRTFWTRNEEPVAPRYSYDPAYVWNFEELHAILPFGQFSQKPWIAKNMQNPQEDWYQYDFDDSNWEVVVGPMCSWNGLKYWNTEFPLHAKYCLRRHFTLNEVDMSNSYGLIIYHDLDCGVWVNGREVLYHNSYGYHTINIDANLLKQGDNVIAVYVRDDNPPASIDFGLYTDAKVESYTATISTDKQIYQIGEKVQINGVLPDVVNTEVEVCIVSDGVSQTVATRTDAQGAFTAEWIPYSGQMGRFFIGVRYHGYDLTEDLAEVNVIGLKRTSNEYITCETAVGEPYTGEIELLNPCQVAQKIKDVEVIRKPANCEVTIDQPSTIPAGGQTKVNFTLTGSTPSRGQEWELIQLRIITEEGASFNVTLYYYCRSQKALLVANVDPLNTTMSKGSSRDYPLIITNQGKGATGKIWLALPNVAWMKAMSAVEIPSLEYGEQATIMLRLAPTDDLPLNIPQTGAIGVNCENGVGLAINFSIEPVSEQTGTLTIDVLDEFSGDDARGPHLVGAKVEVKHPTQGTIIAQGTTGVDGKFSAKLPEGYYNISVSADKHSSYVNNVLVDPGREVLQEVFLNYEAITYSWTMEETEIEDEYVISTQVTFETNVPKPVLIITLPDKKISPNEVFPIIVTNHGLINTEHIDITTVITEGFSFEILNSETVEVLGPQQSCTFYGMIKCDEDLWATSCITAYVLVDGYYKCRGMQHTQSRADLYHCELSSKVTEKLWPGGGGGGPDLYIGGYKTVTGGVNGGSVPWVNWPCESCIARVKLEIKQAVTMGRPAYRGTLILYNGHETTAMTNVRLNLQITDETGYVATGNEFEMTVESLEKFNGEQTLPGNWTLEAQQTGRATILFIPTQLAAQEREKDYTFSGTLTCTDPFSGQELTLPLYPSTFTVQPLPDLELTYLMQRDVYGDDPLTGAKEPMEPAEFALIIYNKGAGDAKNVRVVTEHPKIIENEKGLLIDFDIVGSQVNGDSVSLSLGKIIANDFGTIAAHSQLYAQWWLRSTLLGHFISYEIEANHVTSYGNQDLSLLNNVTIHEMIHGFTVDAKRRGYLVNDIEDDEDLPDVVYLTDATQQPLYIATNANISATSASTYKLTVTPSQAGWNYGSIVDPTNGGLRFMGMKRQSDGAVIPTDNVWQTDRNLRDGREWIYENRIHFVGEMLSGEETYVLSFEDRPDVELAVEQFIGVPAEGTVLDKPLDEVTVRFNKPIKAESFTADDLKLYCQGVKQNAEAIEITRQSNTDFILGLSKVNRQDGYFVLTVQTADITDEDGFNGSEGKTASWIQFPGADYGHNYDLVITSAGYATFYDSQWNYQLPSELKAYVVSGEDDHKLVYRVLADDVVPQGVAVLIESNPLQKGVFTLTSTEKANAYNGPNLLRGTDEATMVPLADNEYVYKLAYGPSGTEWSNVLGWFWGSKNGGTFYIDGHKAWLVVPQKEGKQTRAFLINGEAISDFDYPSTSESHMYDLQGRRVARPVAKGVYIKDGKKITIK